MPASLDDRNPVARAMRPCVRAPAFVSHPFSPRRAATAAPPPTLWPTAATSRHLALDLASPLDLHPNNRTPPSSPPASASASASASPRRSAVSSPPLARGHSPLACLHSPLASPSAFVPPSPLRAAVAARAPSSPRPALACMASPRTRRPDMYAAAALPPRPAANYGATASSPAASTEDKALVEQLQPPQQAQPPQQPPPPTPPESPDPRLIAAGAFFFFLVAAGGVAAATGIINTDTLINLASWFETLGPKAVVLYAGLYFLLELVSVPALPLTLGSGYLFGVVTGTVVVSISSTLAALAAFLIARYGLRDAIEGVAERYPRFRAMDRAIAREGFKFVFLLRLSPLLPFSISNYLYGLTSVDWFQYLGASWLGMLPGTIAYVSAGAAVSALTDLDGGGKPVVSPALVVIGVVATVGAITMIGKLATEAVTAAGGESDSDSTTEGSSS